MAIDPVAAALDAVVSYIDGAVAGVTVRRGFPEGNADPDLSTPLLSVDRGPVRNIPIAPRALAETSSAGMVTKNLTIDTIDDVDDPLVDITSASPSALPSAGAATALASGADGTPAAADYVGDASTLVGIRLFYSDNEDADVAALFVAESASGVIDAVNTVMQLVIVAILLRHARRAEGAVAS